MFGFSGTSVNVALRLAAMLFCMNLFSCNYAQATVFYSNDVFSLPELSANNERSVKQTPPVPVSSENQILIFIDPQCPWCHKALENLSHFKKRTPHWEVKVYVMATIKEFMDFFHQQITTMPDNLEYNLDFKNTLADTYSINQTPTYIIINHGKIKKVEGYVDLAHFVLDDHA
jgi:thioredoxin-related protein